MISPSSPTAYYRRTGYKVPASVALRGAAVAELAPTDKRALFRELLDQTIHGLAFSPYVDGQAPGAQISEAQIRERLAVIEPYVRWIRTFSCIEGHEAIPRIAHERGLQTMVGIGLGEDLDDNEVQIANGIAIARAGHAGILAVGNENMLREDLSEGQIVAYIERVKAAVPGVPVGTVDAYFLFENHPAVADACDVLLVNCYPFWESCPAEYALLYMKEMYRRAQKVANGKEVIITETGWPSVGSAFGDAVPSAETALEYVINAILWANEEGIDLFYFSAFDESWKSSDEGDVGVAWGLWDKDGTLKYA